MLNNDTSRLRNYGITQWVLTSNNTVLTINHFPITGSRTFCVDINIASKTIIGVKAY